MPVCIPQNRSINKHQARKDESFEEFSISHVGAAEYTINSVLANFFQEYIPSIRHNEKLAVYHPPPPLLFCRLISSQEQGHFIHSNNLNKQH